MSVAAEVSLQAIRDELAVAADYAAAAGLILDASTLSEEDLRFFVTFKNKTAEEFLVEFDCTDYPLNPPTIEFLSLDRMQRGEKHLYAKGFHQTPCVCARYNRKAYGEKNGPHKDWRLIDWRLPTQGGIAIDCLALMISDLHSKIQESTGRLA